MSDSEKLLEGIELFEKHSVPQTENPTDKKVFVQINATSSEFINYYALSDTTQELGGVLLGNYAEKDGHFHIWVEAAIEAKHAEAAKSSVKFTHRSWEYINHIKDTQYPDYKVVGWFHTHPGFGIFLSEYDKFIQRNFFNLPWQIAYVVDPLSG